MTTVYEDELYPFYSLTKYNDLNPSGLVHLSETELKNYRETDKKFWEWQQYLEELFNASQH